LRRRLSGWFLSRERNCGCLSNPTDRNSISSCVVRQTRDAFLTPAFFLFLIRRIVAIMRSLSLSLCSLFLSLTLIYFIRAILAVYATYPRPHWAPAHGDKLWRAREHRTFISFIATLLIRRPESAAAMASTASRSHSLLAIGPRLSEDGLRHLNVRDVPLSAGCCLPLIRALPPLHVARSIIYDTYHEVDENLACNLGIFLRSLELHLQSLFFRFLNSLFCWNS